MNHLYFFLLISLFCSCKNEEHHTELVEEPPVNSTISMLQDSLKSTAQQFLIDQSRDTLISCENGTMIYFSKGSFIKENGDSPGSQISLSIKECYNYADFIGENLTTTSDGHILETGGMVNITALDSSNIELALAPEKEYIVFFPKKNQTNDMELFYGKRGNDSIIDWTVAINEEKEEEKAITSSIPENSTIGENVCKLRLSRHTIKIGESPVLWQFVNQEGTIFDYFNSTFNPPAEAIEYMCATNAEINVKINFDKSGDVADIFFVQRANKTCDSLISKFLYDLPLIDMSKMGQPWIKNSYNLGFRGEYHLNREKYKEKFEKKYVSQKDKVIQDIPMAELNYYVFAATELGWINCDRFWNTPEAKEDFYVNINAENPTTVYLAFSDIKSLLKGTNQSNKSSFSEIPQNKEIKIIGIQYISNQAFLSIGKTNSSTNEYTLTNFKPFTLQELEEEINNVN